MKLKLATISVLSIFLAASCTTVSGDFCAVYAPVPPISEEIAQRLVAESRASAVSIAANETTYARECVG